MNKIVPLIGSAEVGPLGVLHLPRLWLKISLDAKRLLADGYPAVGTGFDQMVLMVSDCKRTLSSNMSVTHARLTASSKAGSRSNRERDSIRPQLRDKMRRYGGITMTMAQSSRFLEKMDYLPTPESVTR